MVEKEPRETIQDLLTELHQIQRDWAFHIKEDHRGFIPSTCHRCLNKKQIIIMLEENLKMRLPNP